MVTEEISLRSFLASFITPIVKKAVREELMDMPRTEQTQQLPKYNRVGGIELAQEITGKAESTIYNLVHQGKIPHSKQSGKLYFSESELLDWIRSGKRKSKSEVGADIDNFLGHQGKRKSYS